MILTALIDNTRLNNRADLAVESGLSLHIETLGRKILFDTGRSKAFSDNASLLNINIAEVDALVISHRHHDHGNGVIHFLDNNAKALVYLRKCVENNYYFKFFGFKIDIGINKKWLNKVNTRLSLVDKTTEIFENVFIITQISRKHVQPKGNKYLFTDSGADKFEHELLLVIKENDGLFIFTGCAHLGVLNMIETAIELFPNCRIKAVIGGFHLLGLPLLKGIAGSESDIKVIAKIMSTYPIDKLYTGHCTGLKAYKILKSVLGDRIEYFPTGRCIHI